MLNKFHFDQRLAKAIQFAGDECAVIDAWQQYSVLIPNHALIKFFPSEFFSLPKEILDIEEVWIDEIVPHYKILIRIDEENFERTNLISRLMLQDAIWETSLLPASDSDEGQ